MGGKSGPDYPDPIDPMRTAEAQQMLARQQFEQQQQAQQEQRAYEQQQYEQEQAQRTGDLDAAVAAALGLGQQRASEYGLEGFDPVLENYFNAQRAMVPSTVTDFSGYFGESAVDKLFSDEESRRRRAYENQLRTDLPYGFEQNYFGSEFDDPIINTILEEQYQYALRNVQSARTTGALPEAGYEDALARLGSQRSAAESRLQGLGGGVLSGYRGELTDIYGDALSGARNYALGTEYDPGQFTGRIEQRVGELGQGLEGDIRASLGDTNLFNTDLLLGQASQGLNVNPGGSVGAPDAYTPGAVAGLGAQKQSGGGSPLLTALDAQKQGQTRQKQEEGLF